MYRELLIKSFGLLIYGAVALVMFVKGRWLKNLLGKDGDGPALASAEMLANASLTSMAEGTIAGYKYNLLYNDGRLMVLVDLGYKTGVHIVATGDRSKIDKGIFVRNKWLKPLELEGDFPEYFRMYCSPGKEMELLTIFEPKTMAYFVDFCRSHNFEIYEDSLYISQSDNAADNTDTTTMIQDAEDFLKNQDPTLRRLNSTYQS